MLKLLPSSFNGIFTTPEPDGVFGRTDPTLD